MPAVSISIDISSKIATGRALMRSGILQSSASASIFNVYNQDECIMNQPHASRGPLCPDIRLVNATQVGYARGTVWDDDGNGRFRGCGIL